MSENTLSLLLTFPPHPPPPQFGEAEYNSQAKKFQENLLKLSSSALTAGIKSGEGFLDILNPAINSISYLFVLHAHITTPNPKAKSWTQSISDSFAPDKPLWLKTVKFIEQFDPVQIRYCGHEIRRLIEIVAHVSLVTQKPAVGIYPVRTAILRIDPSSATFTSSHRLLPHLCLLARDYSAALALLDKDIYHFPNMTTKAAEMSVDPLHPYPSSEHESSSNFINSASGLTRKPEYQDHLSYFLYGAMCYIALKKWERALLFLAAVLQSPTANNASKIQVEAYKKWILVSLLQRGKTSPLPRTTNSQASKIYQSLGRAYIGLSEVFQAGLNNEESNTKLVAEIHEGDQIWSEDLNAGLIRQVVQAYRFFSILKLGNTYAALPITEVTQRTSPTPDDNAETAQYLTDLIKEGKLSASVSKPSAEPGSWLLRFHDPFEKAPQPHTEEQIHNELNLQMAKIQTLMKHVKEADRRFGLSKEFIAESKRIQKAKESGNGVQGIEENWGPPDAAFDQDEDVMAD